MLVTLGAVGSGNVDFTLVAAFTAGVMLIFLGFGVILASLNKNILSNVKNVRRAFGIAGIISLIVRTNILLG